MEYELKETPLCFGNIRKNNMSRLIVFSDQFSNKKLNSISVGKVENSNMPVVLVVVREGSREKMEKLAGKYGFNPPVDFMDYIDNELSSDKQYVLKEDIISSLKQFGFFDFFGGTAIVAA